MKRHGSLFLIGLAILMAAPFASAADRVEFPEDQPVVPVYARFETVDDTG